MAVVGKDREAPDEPLAALDQVDRTGEHQLSAVARPQRRFPLRLVFAVVEADRALVALERTHQRDDQVRRRRDVPELRSFLSRFDTRSENRA